MDEQNEYLAAFLYLLMRDHLPTGKVESIMEGLRAMTAGGGAIVFSASDLVSYARSLAAEIRQLSDLAQARRMASAGEPLIRT
jgi:hypothetical protein